MTSTIEWNPNWPSQIGMEHRQPGYSHGSLNSFSTMQAFSFVASQTTTVDQLSIFTSSTSSGAILSARYGGLYRPIMVEIFEDDDATSFALSSTEYTPAIITGTSMWNENLTAGSVNRIQTKNDGLYMVAQFNNASHVHIQFGGSLNAFPLDRTVHWLRTIVRTNATFRIHRYGPGSPSESMWYSDVPAYNPTGFSDINVDTGEVKIDENVSPAWTIWTPAQVREFGGTTRARSYLIKCIAGGGGGWKLDYVGLRVYWSMSPRVGYGVVQLPTSSLEWVNFPITKPDGTALTLTSGQRYTAIVRQIYDYSDSVGRGSALSLRSMRSPSGTYDEWEPREITGYGTASAATTTPTTGGIASAVFSSGGSTTEMSQPYTLNRAVAITDETNIFAEQTLTVTGSATSELYGQVVASIGWTTTPEPPGDAVIRCEVFDSMGVRVLGAVENSLTDMKRLTLDANGDSDDSGTQYRRVRFLFDEGTTLSAGTYTVRLTCPSVLPTGATFRILGMHSNQSVLTPPTPDRTFGAGDVVPGATDAAWGFFYSGSTAVPIHSAPYSSDLGLVLTTVPQAPTGISSSHGVITTHNAKICPACNDQTSDCTGCSDSSLPFAHVSWLAVTGGAGVDYYAVERQDDFSPDWEPVGVVRDGLTYFSDIEARIGIPTRYRVRAVDTVGIPGAWSSTTSVTLGPYGGNPGMALLFSSNAATNMSTVYPETWDGDVERQFDFAEADDVVFGAIYGRERQVAFHPIERKGIEFSRTLLLNAVCSVQHPTLNIFQPIRDLAWAPIPYVCVRDGEGNRWYANLRVTRGINRRPGEMWYALVTITEVAASSHVYDSSVAQVESVPSGPT